MTMAPHNNRFNITASHKNTNDTKQYDNNNDNNPIHVPIDNSVQVYMDEMFFFRSINKIYSSASILFDDNCVTPTSKNRSNIATVSLLSSRLKRRDSPRYNWRK